jgi:Ca-activated chloride channel family protein
MKIIKLLLLTAIILTAFSVGTFAQDEAISVETNLVTLNVAVTDRNGNYVKNLKKEDFEVFDRNIKQEIEQFSAEESPVYFGIVYDMHPTTGESAKNVLDALRQFTKGLKQKDNFFITVFNERGSLTTDFVPTSEQIETALSDAKPNTPNSLYDAVFVASDKVRENKNAKQILIILTDGEDHSSHHSLKELRQHLRGVNLPVYTINFNSQNRPSWGYTDIHRGQQRQTLGTLETNQLNTAALDELSRTSGGQSFEQMIQNRLYLYTIFKKVLDEVENQYVIGFYPETVDNQWHKLKVNVKADKGNKYRLSNRKGYQSLSRKG